MKNIQNEKQECTSISTKVEFFSIYPIENFGKLTLGLLDIETHGQEKCIAPFLGVYLVDRSPYKKGGLKLMHNRSVRGAVEDSEGNY